MLNQAFVIAATAFLSALATWALAYLWYELRLQAQLNAMLAETQNEFERRVKKGVLEAGEELLPQLREQVRRGFEDALAKSETANVVESAAGVVNLGTDIISSSLSSFLGIKPGRK